MRVDIHELAPDGAHVLAGSYTLHAGEIRPVPSQVPGSLTLLNNVLASVTIPVHGGDNITPLTDPRGWLEGLHTRLRSPYLQATRATTTDREVRAAVELPRLPAIPEGFNRYTHFTSRASALRTHTEGLAYHGQGLLTSTADPHGQDQASVEHTLRTRTAGGLSRKMFGDGHAIVLDIPEREARTHDNVSEAPGFVHHSRVVGTVHPDTGSFTPNPSYDPHHTPAYPTRGHALPTARRNTSGGIPRPPAGGTTDHAEVW